MALIFIEGFDNYKDSSDLHTTWVPIAGSVFGLYTSGRNGSKSIRTDNYYNVASKYFNSYKIGTSVIAGVACYLDSTDGTTMFSFCDGIYPQIFVTRGSDSSLYVMNAVGSYGSTLAGPSVKKIFTGVWYYLELKVYIHSTSGSFELRVDGVPVLSASGVNTMPYGSSGVNNFSIGKFQNTNGLRYCRYDDIYVCDSSGSKNNNFLGDCSVISLYPNADGTTTQFTPTGNANNWMCVDESSNDGDNTYVSSSTVGNKDLYNITAITNNPNVIHGAQIKTLMKSSDAGPIGVRNIVLSGSTTANGNTESITTTYTRYSTILEDDPNTSSAWTKSAIDNLQIGVEIVS